MIARSSIVALLFAAPLYAADIQMLSGKRLAGEIVGLDKQVLIVKTADSEGRHPLAEVLLIDFAAAEPSNGPFDDIELLDGSTFHCTKIEFKGKTCQVTALPDLVVQIPIASIYTLCRGAHDPRVRAEFQQFVAKRGRFDQVALRSDGRLNALEGTLGDGSPQGDGIEFTVTETNQKTTPKLAKIAGLVFVPRADPNAPPALCKITDAGRNVLVAAEVVFNDKGFTATSVAGLKVAYSDGIKRIARLDFSKGKLTYLSDMEPVRAEISLSTEDNDQYGKFVRYRRDKNLENGPLRLDGVTHAKGLALHAGSVLVYDLGGEYTALRAILGVDEGVQTESKVEVVIEAAGRELFRGTIGRRDTAKPLSLDVKGVQQLRIEVRPTGLLELGGEVNLADAKVSK